MYKPPYWFLKNYKFDQSEINQIKNNLIQRKEELAVELKFANNITSFFSNNKPEAIYVEKYKKIVEEITQSAGIYHHCRYDFNYWTQAYEDGHDHVPHHHVGPKPPIQGVTNNEISFVHFLDVPEKKLFRFVDGAGNSHYPEEQKNGDIIYFPSWAWHQVIGNDTGHVRLVIAGNITVTQFNEISYEKKSN